MKGVKRLLLLAGLIGLAAMAGAVGTVVGREREYRHLIAEADRALAADDTFAAIEALSGALALKPASMAAHLKRAEAYRRRGELASSLRDLHRAVELDPSALRALELLGDVHYASTRYDRAVEHYARAVRLDDRNPRLLYKLALARYRTGNPAAAVAPLQQAAALDERFAEAQYLVGLCLRDLGRLGEGAQAIARAVELAPASVAAREALAQLLVELGRPAEAIEHLEALAALEPRRPERHVALARQYAQAGQTDLAVLALGRAATRFPGHPQIYLALARIWLDLADLHRDRVALGKAREALARVLLVAPRSSELATLNGRALLLSGDLDGAAGALGEATRRWPVEPEAFRLLATVSERLGRPRTARDALARYLALVGDTLPAASRAAAAAHVAALALALGDAADAAAWYERALADRPEDPRLTVGLVEAYRRQGHLDAARRALDEALARTPRHAALLALQHRLP